MAVGTPELVIYLVCDSVMYNSIWGLACTALMVYSACIFLYTSENFSFFVIHILIIVRYGKYSKTSFYCMCTGKTILRKKNMIDFNRLNILNLIRLT